MPRVTPGRNDRCPCGSGKKYKQCCLGKDAPQSAADEAAAPAEFGPSAPLAQSAVSALITLANAGRYEDMELQAHALTKSRPSSGVAWKALSVALQMQGKEAFNALHRAAQLLPHDAEAHSNLGVALRRSGRLDEAILCLRRALELRPGLAEAWNNLGNAERDLGHPDAAIAALSEALRLKPGFAKAHHNLGNALMDLGRLDEAIASYRRALECDASYAEAHSSLASILRLQGRQAEAQVHCEGALAIDPNHSAAITLLAHLHSDRGEFAEARAVLGRAIAVDPRCAEAWAALAGLGQMSGEDEEWLRGAMRLADGAPPRDEIPLRYAIGKYFDDLGQYDDAFKNYERANWLAKSLRPRHDQAALSAAVGRVLDAQAAERLSVGVPGIDSDRPVLIVGMPRSGTTLAEQILASHPQVQGAGELPFWNAAAGRWIAPPSGESTLRQFAEDYLAVLDEASPDAPRVVDKMPANFMFLGLIHAAVPRARIIHLTRNPIDTCLSIYFQNFGTVHAYANDLDDLAHYYGQYLRVMDHWRRVLPPGVLLDVPYEALVENPEHWSRAMIEHIALPWHARCLEFHATARMVSTFSKWQVRQPIHRASVARWRHYEKFLGPLWSLQA